MQQVSQSNEVQWYSADEDSDDSFASFDILKKLGEW